MPTANEPASGWQLIGDGAEAYERFLVPSRRMTRTTIATALALAAALGGATPARADTTLTSCAPPEFAAAVAAGGIVRFAVDCPTLIPATTTTVGVGKVLVIEGDGHTVTLRGANQRRLFRVTGGQLTVRGVTLQGGAAVGANGAAGTPGTAGIAGALGQQRRHRFRRRRRDLWGRGPQRLGRHRRGPWRGRDRPGWAEPCTSPAVAPCSIR